MLPLATVVGGKKDNTRRRGGRLTRVTTVSYTHLIYEKTSACRNDRFASFYLVAYGARDTGRSDYGI